MQDRWLSGEVEERVFDRAQGDRAAPTEEAQIMSLKRSPRFARLSPKQSVPQLADERLYVGDLLSSAAPIWASYAKASHEQD
jgi:hypothetical protein